MPTVKLVALKKHPYGKSYLQPDEPFEAPERDANLLVRLGVAKRADAGAHPEQPIVEPPPQPTHPIVEPPAPEPTPLPVESSEAEPGAEAEPMTTKGTTKRGTYKRRDLTAEGDE
jgi:hypothetical protein